jgi:excisionase family DNA binding protein
MEKSDRLLLRISEVAQMIGVSRSLAYEMAAKGELPVVRIRGGLRVPADALTAWIAEKMNAAGVAVTTEGDASSHAYRRSFGKHKLGED